MQSCNIRPHHGLCTAFFEGKGYSDDFTANMLEMITMLEKLDPIVTLTMGTDIICQKCPNNRKDRCASPKPSVYDARVLDIIGLDVNTNLKWSIFRNTVRDKIIKKGRLNEVCSDCQWYEICGKKPS